MPVDITSGSGRRARFRGHAWRVVVAATVLAGAVVPAFAGLVAARLARADRVPLAASPSSLGLAYRDVEFASRGDGLRLRGWYMPAAPVESGRSVVLVHGQHGNRADPYIGLLPLAKALVERGYNVLTFDLRGHGESEGQYRSFGQHEKNDLIGAVDFLAGLGQPGEWVGVIGFSMGAGTVLLAAPEDRRIRAVVADSSYADIRELIDAGLADAAGLPSFLAPAVVLTGKVLLGIDVDAVKPELLAARIAPRPLLIVHGETDAVVPVAHAHRIAAACPRAEVWVCRDAGHCEAFTSDPAEYLRRVEATFARAAR